jgi:hypothetical protein
VRVCNKGGRGGERVRVSNRGGGEGEGSGCGCATRGGKGGSG